MDQQASRYIEKQVREAVFVAARSRCCLCRELIAVEVPAVPSQRAIELHHIVFFSEGGPNTEDNLMLVCANCHFVIHADRSNYSAELLKKAKTHWIGMADIVPSKLSYRGAVNEDFQTPFLIESLNLCYLITLPSVTTVSNLASFIRQKIIQPLGFYDGNLTWQVARDIKLALRSTPTVYLAGEQPIQNVLIPAGESLVAVVEMPVLLEIPPVLPIPIETLRRKIRIHHPSQGGVQHIEIVRGSIGFPIEKVWVLVRPLNSSNYWVQPPSVVLHDGKWSVMAYFGNTYDRGVQFEVIALTDNTGSLKEGMILRSIPQGCRLSEAIHVWRLGGFSRA